MPHRPTTDRELSTADAGGEDLEELDGIGEVSQGWLLGEGTTEVGPNDPGFVALIAALSSDAGSGLCLRSAEVNEEAIAGLKWHDCQGSLCGHVVQKCVSKALSARRQMREQSSAITFWGPLMWARRGRYRLCCW